MAVENTTESNRDLAGAYVDRRLLGGSAVLLTGGLLMWLAGATIGAVAVVSGCRRYVAAREEAPGQAARRRWDQVRSATSAGVGAWREYDPQTGPHLVR